MKTYFYYVMLVIMAALMFSCTNHKRPMIDESVESDSTELSEYNYVPTVHDVLEERQELKYALWCDSVYINMPEQILTHLLVTKGTTQSIKEIVEDYTTNKQFYHDTILKAMTIQKKYIPDSLPKISIPDKGTKDKDSIPIYEK